MVVIAYEKKLLKLELTGFKSTGTQMGTQMELKWDSSETQMGLKWDSNGTQISIDSNSNVIILLVTLKQTPPTGGIMGESDFWHFFFSGEIC